MPRDRAGRPTALLSRRRARSSVAQRPARLRRRMGLALCGAMAAIRSPRSRPSCSLPPWCSPAAARPAGLLLAPLAAALPLPSRCGSRCSRPREPPPPPAALAEGTGAGSSGGRCRPADRALPRRVLQRGARGRAAPGAPLRRRDRARDPRPRRLQAGQRPPRARGRQRGAARGGQRGAQGRARLRPRGALRRRGARAARARGRALRDRGRARVVEGLRDLRFAGGLQVTCSAGVAALAEGGDSASLFASADEALYEAKRRGKNRVVVARRPRGVARRRAAGTA